MPKKTVKRRAAKPVRRRRRGFGRVYAIVCALLVVALIVGGVAVFFRAENFTVTGNTVYSRAEIIAASGLHKGDNLYFFNKFSIQEQMCRRLPYLESVRITRTLPNTLHITAVETAAALAVRDGEQYVLISPAGKVLERVTDAKEVPVAEGVVVTSAVAGERLLTDPLPQTDTISGILTVLAEHGLADRLTGLTLNGAYYVTLGYGDRVTVRLGLAAGQTERKIRALGQILSELESGVSGQLDMTGSDYRFVPDAPAPSAAPSPSPTPAEGENEGNSGA